MKTTIKLALFVCLFSSVVFADGEMTNGGRNCMGCLMAGQTSEKETNNGESQDSVLIHVREYLNAMFKYFEN